MVDQKKESPPKGEFIDLDKSDFKKKTSFFQITFKYLIIFLIFFSLGFFTYKPLKENLYYKFNVILLKITEFQMTCIANIFKNISEHILWLPSSTNLTKDQMQEVVDKVTTFCATKEF